MFRDLWGKTSARKDKSRIIVAIHSNINFTALENTVILLGSSLPIFYFLQRSLISLMFRKCI